VSYQVGSACYETPEAAASAAASAQVGGIVQNGAVSYVVNASSVDGSSITYVLSPVAGGVPLTVVAPFTAQPCGMLGTADAVQMGWLVAAAWCGVWAVKFMATAIKDWGDQHGNA